MAGIGIVVLIFGYWLVYYGVDQVRGGNDGFLALGIPGRFAAVGGTQPKDGAGKSSGPSQGGAQISKGGAKPGQTKAGHGAGNAIGKHG